MRTRIAHQQTIRFMNSGICRLERSRRAARFLCPMVIHPSDPTAVMRRSGPVVHFRQQSIASGARDPSSALMARQKLASLATSLARASRLRNKGGPYRSGGSMPLAGTPGEGAPDIAHGSGRSGARSARQILHYVCDRLSTGEGTNSVRNSGDLHAFPDVPDEVRTTANSKLGSTPGAQNWTPTAHRWLISARRTLRICTGGGGHPGTVASTGMTADTGPMHA